MHDLNKGRYKALSRRDEFVDYGRQERRIPFKVFFPHYSELKNPSVVIWSHGLGGSREGSGYIAEALASNGYVVINLTHIGTDSSLWIGFPEDPIYLLSKVVIDEISLSERFHDVCFVLNNIDQWYGKNISGSQILNLDEVGLAGHSLGAYTTQVLAGQKVSSDTSISPSFRDPRIAAGILYSPIPSGYIGKRDKNLSIYSNIDIPLLHMVGTRDDCPFNRFSYEERLEVYLNTKSTKKYMYMLDNGDHSIYNMIPANDELLTKNAKDIVEVSLAFWNSELRGDHYAEKWLKHRCT